MLCSLLNSSSLYSILPLHGPYKYILLKSKNQERFSLFLILIISRMVSNKTPLVFTVQIFNCKTKCRFYSPFTLTIVRLVLQTLSKTIESNNFHNKTTMNTKGHGCFYKDIIHLTIRHSGIDTPPN